MNTGRFSKPACVSTCFRMGLTTIITGKTEAGWNFLVSRCNYSGWTKIQHHFETMVQAIVCWYLQGNRIIPGFLNGGADGFRNHQYHLKHGLSLAPKILSPGKPVLRKRHSTMKQNTATHDKSHLARASHAPQRTFNKKELPRQEAEQNNIKHTNSEAN